MFHNFAGSKLFSPKIKFPMRYLPSFIILLCFSLPLGLSAQSGPAGEWKTMIPDQEGNMIPLLVSIKADNTYSVDFGADGVVEINGTYKSEDGQITIRDNEGSECTGKGVYKYEVTADGMTMTRVSEECEGRGGPEGKMEFSRG